ncbi:hypothetical protein [Aeromonas enteropelogenes]|uniref:hypothetical protein n=1 Tax=Aeromonas enteropelogenes TaxID=29489 RepID=UPI003BA16633
MEKLGLLITFFWCLMIVMLIWLKWESAVSMSLNEWGDFLAGMTAPITFLWLIIGYILQRKELHLNTEALIMTKNEMARQGNELNEQTQHIKMQAHAAEIQSSSTRRKELREILLRNTTHHREE